VGKKDREFRIFTKYGRTRKYRLSIVQGAKYFVETAARGRSHEQRHAQIFLASGTDQVFAAPIAGCNRRRGSGEINHVRYKRATNNSFFRFYAKNKKREAADDEKNRGLQRAGSLTSSFVNAGSSALAAATAIFVATGNTRASDCASFTLSFLLFFFLPFIGLTDWSTNAKKGAWSPLGTNVCSYLSLTLAFKKVTRFF
jgi:hypothetical protein